MENKPHVLASSAIQSFQKKAAARRTLSEKFADFVTDYFGSMHFLVINCMVFVAWIVWNLHLIPSLVAFDPYPFGLLTMAVSLEAIILSVFVLISQSRESKIGELREEVALNVNMISEKEITKIMSLLVILCEKNGINVDYDVEIKEMLRPVDTDHIEKTLEKQIF